MNIRPNGPLPESEPDPYRGIFDAASDGLMLVDLDTGVIVEANPAACAMHGYTREAFLGLHAAELIHPDRRQVFSHYLRTVRSGPVVDARALHLRRNGSTFHAEWRGTALTYQGRPCLLGAVRDISRRVQADERLRQRVKTRTHEQAALLRISHTLASTPELQPDLILGQFRAIIEYTHAGIFRLNDSTLSSLAVRGPRHLEQTAPFQVHLEIGETLPSWFSGRRPIRIADIRSVDPAATSLRSLLNGDAAILLEGVRAWMWVPLVVKDRVLGGLGVAHVRRNYFTAHHAALALSMANQVAMAMVNAELYEHARELAALQERQRLARNLHDAVNQSLFSAGLIAEVLPRLWEREPEEARQSLEDLRRLTRGALAEMRGLLAELRPSVLTDSSLGDLLRQLANAFTGRTNVPARVTITGEHVLSERLQVALYRICQEALSNIAKHAGASRVEIYLRYETGAPPPSSQPAQAGPPQASVVRSVEMRIHDDGRGYDTSQPAVSGHYGLDMMHERAVAVGARLTFSSQPGRGTELLMRWQETPEQEAQ